MTSPIRLDADQIRLLDTALRLAYTRLVDTGAARGRQFQEVRDPLVVPMVNAILKGEKDKWRLARRGLFAACDEIAFGRGRLAQSASKAEIAA